MRCFLDDTGRVARIGKDIGPGSAGEAVGLYRASADAIRNADLPTRLGESPPQDYYEDAFDRALRAAGPDALDMAAIDVIGFACVEVDDADDYAAARAAVLPPPPPGEILMGWRCVWVHHLLAGI